MVQAQEWLGEKYPNKEEVDNIWWGRDEGEISGELIIADFPQLEKINVSDRMPPYMRGNKGNLTQLHLKNCPQLTELDCSDNKLTELTITNCPNLQIINAKYNQLTNLDLRDNTALTALYLSNNKLTQLDLSNNQQLERLDVTDNNFSSDLFFLSHLVNLRGLCLGDNNFTGSLKPLRNLSKLRRLDIGDLSQGLEYLPEHIYDFFCKQKTKLAQELELFGGWKKWRETNKELIGEKLTNEKLLVIANIIGSVANRSSVNIQLAKVCQVLVFYLEEEVIKCRKELYQEREEKLQTQIQILPKN